MILRSFAYDGNSLVPIEVELTLWPGLPVIQILGLPDQQIKESTARIKSAIKAQGFRFPKSQQILVNLRPNSLKKNSSGVELAVAVAYLLETKQIKIEEKSLQNLFVYGELNLSGDVFEPKDFQKTFYQDTEAQLITGAPLTPQSFCAVRKKAQISSLSQLRASLEFINTENKMNYIRPKTFDSLLWTVEQAELLAVVAAGEHHALFVGPGGVGKTTMATAVHQLLRPPTSGSNEWRPFVRPHHSLPPKAMIGGGTQALGGEITRAHGGILFLDEFLEFESEVIENLREPIEEGVIRIARGSISRTLPAEFQMLATSNLCPCGNWTPENNLIKTCRFTKRKCRSYAERFSGPLLDRFHLVSFIKQTFATRDVSTERILCRIQEAEEFRKQKGRTETNSKIPIGVLEKEIEKSSLLHLLPRFGQSERRRIAMLRVARTLADLDLESQILPRHLQKSIDLTVNNFERLSRWDS